MMRSPVSAIRFERVLRQMAEISGQANGQRRLALITGASSGIGTAFARHAAQEGFDVALVARREDRLQVLASELSGQHPISASFFRADLCSPDSSANICNWLMARERSVDVLVNNAGYSVPQTLMSRDLGVHLDYLELSVSGTVALTYHCLRGMLDRGWGRIINISSMAAFSSGGKGHTLYPASKSFIIKFSQSLNAEVASRGVRVSAVCPGFVDTEFQLANNMADKMKSIPKFLKQTPNEVAREAWRRNDAGAEIIVPGLMPKVAAAFMDVAPERLLRPMMRGAAAKFYIGD